MNNPAYPDANLQIKDENINNLPVLKITKNKLKTSEAKQMSKLHQKINVSHKRLVLLEKIACERKQQVRVCSAFISKLIAEGRVTKDELREVFTKRKK